MDLRSGWSCAGWVRAGSAAVLPGASGRRQWAARRGDRSRRGRRPPSSWCRVQHPADPPVGGRRVALAGFCVPESPRGDHGQGEDAVPGDRIEPAAPGPPRPAEPGRAGAGAPTSGSGVLGDLLLPTSLLLANGLALATPKAPEVDLEAAPPSVLWRVVADWQGDQALRPLKRDHRLVPVPRNEDPSPLPGRSAGERIPRTLDRACGEPVASKGARVREAPMSPRLTDVCHLSCSYSTIAS